MKDAVDLLNERIAELEVAVLREKRRVDSLHYYINEKDAEIARLREFAEWCADLEAARDLWGGMSDLDWFVAIEEKAKEALQESSVPEPTLTDHTEECKEGNFAGGCICGFREQR
jgi:hypothetical protein